MTTDPTATGQSASSTRAPIRRSRVPDAVVGGLVALLVIGVLVWTWTRPDDPRQAELDELGERFSQRYGVDVSGTYYNEPTGGVGAASRGVTIIETRYVEVWTVGGVVYDGTCEVVDTRGEDQRLFCDGEELPLPE